MTDTLHMIHNATLSPAHGRDYKTVADLKADFEGGRSFIAHNIDGQPTTTLCSIRDFAPTYSVVIRYGKMRRATTITVR